MSFIIDIMTKKNSKKLKLDTFMKHRWLYKYTLYVQSIHCTNLGRVIVGGLKPTTFHIL